MILKTTIAAKVMRRGFEQASSVLEDNLFQYLESEIKSAILRETMREIVAKAPLWERTSKGNKV